MLKVLLIVFGVGLICVAFFFFARGGDAWPAGIMPFIFGCVLLIGTVFERRYRPKMNMRSGNWQKTGERFLDPATGKTVDVYYDPNTGERSYQDAEATAGS